MKELLFVLPMAFFVMYISAEDLLFDEKMRILNDHSKTRYTESLKEKDKKIDFYGIVVDDFDFPVNGANCVIEVERFSPNSKTFTQIEKYQFFTDVNGIFEVENLTGKRLLIKKISKSGFFF